VKHSALRRPITIRASTPTEQRSKLDLTVISAGVSWATDCALGRGKDFWALATRAELALVENDANATIEDYGEAAALAVTNRDRFAIDPLSQQPDFLGSSISAGKL
jgi:hypothetical protein